MVSEYNDYGEEDNIGLDISCNLGALNIKNVMNTKTIKESVELSIDALNDISTSSNVKNAPAVNKANKLMRSVGLGTLNLHGYLTSVGIAYDSKEAIDFVAHFFSSMRFYALKRSMETARDTGETFYKFEGSGYSDGTFFDDYIENKMPKDFKFDKVAELFKDMEMPTVEDWKQLKADVMEHGLYNSYLLAQMPTGSVSYIQSATAAVMPIKERVENRTYGNSKTYYPMPELSNKTWFFYKEAYDMDMLRVVDLMAEIQKHIDQGISFELFVKDSITTRELTRIQLYAHHKGIKTLYYVRQKDVGQAECLSCAV